jgi:DNA invertase Pin-like site-specific DNA recombinase
MPAPILPPGLRAVAYYRASTSKQEASIPEQKEWAEGAADARGLTLAGSFEDFDKRGSSLHRPGYDAFKAFLAAGRDASPARRHKPAPAALVLLVWDLCRLSRRDLTDAQAELSVIRSSGVRWVVTVNQTFDLYNAFDRVMLAISQELGKRAFSASLALAVARSAASRAALGLWVSGRPPYGYRVNRKTGKLVRHPGQARVFKGAVADLLAGKSLGEVAYDLNARGVPGPGRSGAWRRDTLQHMVTDPVYTGLFEWPRTRQGKYAFAGKDGAKALDGGNDERTYVPAPAGERFVFPNNHPALITSEEQEAVKAALAGRRWKRTTPVLGGGEWVLSGLAYCGSCGSRLYGRNDRQYRKGVAYVYRRLFCPGNSRHGKGTCTYKGALQAAVVEALVEHIPGWFREPSRQAELTEQLEARAALQTNTRTRDLADLDARIADLDRVIARALDNVLDISRDLRPAAEARLRQRQAERAELARRRDALAREARTQTGRLSELKDALGSLATLKDRVAQAPPALLRRLFETMCEKVVVHFAAGAPELEITFRPELSDLLPSVPKWPSRSWESP